MLGFPPFNYNGIDISDGMLKVAQEQHPGHWFFNESFEEFTGDAHDIVLAIYGQVNYMGLESFVEAVGKFCSHKFLAVLYSGADNPDCSYTTEHQNIYAPSEIYHAFQGSGFKVNIKGLSDNRVKPSSDTLRWLSDQATSTILSSARNNNVHYFKYIMVSGELNA